MVLDGRLIILLRRSSLSRLVIVSTGIQIVILRIQRFYPVIYFRLADICLFYEERLILELLPFSIVFGVYYFHVFIQLNDVGITDVHVSWCLYFRCEDIFVQFIQ